MDVEINTSVVERPASYEDVGSTTPYLTDISRTAMRVKLVLEPQVLQLTGHKIEEFFILENYESREILNLTTDTENSC